VTLYHSTTAGAPTAPAGGRVAGVSFGHRELAEADHWILSLDPAPAYACTHLVREPYPHVAISLTGASAPDSAPELRSAAEAAATGRFGRAVLFPGVERLVGVLSVADVLALSAIERVEVLGGGTADATATLDTTGFVRPQWRDGELILTAVPAAGGRLVPFEVRSPTPCCAEHP
jgi:hypothetical protein